MVFPEMGMEACRKNRLGREDPEFSFGHDCSLDIQVQMLRLEFWEEVSTGDIKSQHI